MLHARDRIQLLASRPPARNGSRGVRSCTTFALLDARPYLLKHKFSVPSFVPERLIHAAGSTGLGEFHPAFKIDTLRSLNFPANASYVGCPEALLLANRDAYAGALAPYIVGSAGDSGDYNFGSSCLLTPPVEGEGVMLATAAHNLWPPNAFFQLGARTPAVVENDPSLAPLLKAFAPLYSLDPHVVQVEQAGRKHMNQLWPFTFESGWEADMKLDFVVPAHYTPSNVAVIGYAGSITTEDAEALYGATSDKAAAVAAALSASVLPAQSLIVAAGDCIAANQGFLLHRASCNYGMSGSGVRDLQQPQLLVGIHIGSANGDEYNVSTSVNNPCFVCLYVSHVMPRMCAVTTWPAPYMVSALCAYLLHHRALLERHGMWEPHAAAFVRSHNI